MDFIQIMVLGVITGIIISVIDPHRTEGGIVGAILVGLVGSFSGSVLYTFLRTVGFESLMPMYLVAIISAWVLLMIGRDVKRI